MTHPVTSYTPSFIKKIMTRLTQRTPVCLDDAIKCAHRVVDITLKVGLYIHVRQRERRKTSSENIHCIMESVQRKRVLKS